MIFICIVNDNYHFIVQETRTQNFSNYQLKKIVR